MRGQLAAAAAGTVALEAGAGTAAVGIVAGVVAGTAAEAEAETAAVAGTVAAGT